MAAQTGSVFTTRITQFIPELWSLEVIDSYENNHVFVDLVDRSFDELAKATYGDKINVPSVSSFTAGTKSNEEDEWAFYYQDDSMVTITVATWKGLGIRIPNLVEVQSMPSMRKAYTAKMGMAVSEAIDDDLAAEMDDFSNEVGTNAVALTDGNLRRTRQYFDDNNIPMDNRVMVVSPATLMEFYDVDKYANSLYRGTSVAADKGRGYVGPLYGFDVYESANLDATTDGHDNAAFHKKAIALVMAEGPRTEAWRNVGRSCDEVIVHATWGVKLMRNTDGGVFMPGL